MRIRALFLLVAALLTNSPIALAAPPFERVPGSELGTQPAINDHGEIAFVVPGSCGSGDVVSTKRGHLVTCVDASNLGLGNDGELVWSDGTSTSVVTSTTRGVLVPTRSFGPSISANTGEVAYQNGGGDTNFATTLQGQVEAFDRQHFSVGMGDVNDHGEVVFELRDFQNPFTSVYSTVRGYVSPPGNAIQPAINNSGEVVWAGFDSGGRQQIFSSVRGQLTRFGGKRSFSTADLPDINNRGDVVFRGVMNGAQGIYVLRGKRPRKK